MRANKNCNYVSRLASLSRNGDTSIPSIANVLRFAGVGGPFSRQCLFITASSSDHSISNTIHYTLCVPPATHGLAGTRGCGKHAPAKGFDCSGRMACPPREPHERQVSFQAREICRYALPICISNVRTFRGLLDPLFPIFWLAFHWSHTRTDCSPPLPALPSIVVESCRLI